MSLDVHPTTGMEVVSTIDRIVSHYAHPRVSIPYIHVLVVICIRMCSVWISEHPGPRLDSIRVVVKMGHERISSPFGGRYAMCLFTSFHSRIIPPIDDLRLVIDPVEVNRYGTFPIWDRVVAEFAIVGGLVVQLLEF